MCSLIRLDMYMNGYNRVFVYLSTIAFKFYQQVINRRKYPNYGIAGLPKSADLCTIKIYITKFINYGKDLSKAH